MEPGTAKTNTKISMQINDKMDVVIKLNSAKEIKRRKSTNLTESQNMLEAKKYLIYIQKAHVNL